jgi:hypothetical protein
MSAATSSMHGKLRGAPVCFVMEQCYVASTITSTKLSVVLSARRQRRAKHARGR